VAAPLRKHTLPASGMRPQTSPCSSPTVAAYMHCLLPVSTAGRLLQYLLMQHVSMARTTRDTCPAWPHTPTTAGPLTRCRCHICRAARRV